MLCEALRLQEKNVRSLQKRIADGAKVEEENARLREEVARLKREIFGTSSEKSADPQPEPAPVPDEPVAQEQAQADQPVKKARASGAGRKPLPEHLPRERIEYDLPPQEKFCPCCKGSIHRIGEEVTEQLTVIPAQYKVLQHARAKYVCRACNEFVTAQGVKPLIEKSSYASPDFLAHVACSKYQYGLPFYRQEKIFEQSGLPFNRTTLANLMIGCSDKLAALHEVLRQHLLSQDVIHADETSVQVLKETDRRPESKSFLWLYRSRQDAQQQIVLFDYQMTRSGEHPRRFLNIGMDGAFTGYIHVDGYSGYNGLTGTTRVGCMAHARRKFVEALKLLPAGVTSSPANIAEELLGKLYGIERRIKGLDHQVRGKIRAEESMPLLMEFKDWLERTYPTVAPKLALGKAMGYALEQWQALSRFVEDGRLAIDNNLAEREIKAVVIGRKNWLFADSMEGMRANATMYSLVQTAKANGLNPFDYLKYVFATMPLLTTRAEVECLLPWNMAH
jgi:transposase